MCASLPPPGTEWGAGGLAQAARGGAAVSTGDPRARTEGVACAAGARLTERVITGRWVAKGPAGTGPWVCRSDRW